MNKIKRFITDKEFRFDILASRGMLNFMSDERYLKIKYKLVFGKELNLENPQTFNEKLQWLKIYDRKPIYTAMVDKYEVKKYVQNIIGKQYIIPTLGVWDKFEDIDFDSLPDQFVLKCTHDSGGLVVCNNKAAFDKQAAQKKIDKSLKRNYFYSGREWPYKNVRPRIIAEKYLENNEQGLHDYKIWCFNGKPVYVQYITGRIGEHTYEGFYNTKWELQDFSYHNPRMDQSIRKPICLDELLNLAGQLASGHAFVRCDFYILEDGCIRFGEITFYPMSGFESWKPIEMNEILGKKINLSGGEK